MFECIYVCIYKKNLIIKIKDKNYEDTRFGTIKIIIKLLIL
jgi:hypothetical protein